MNPHYQNAPPRQYDQRTPPHTQQHSQPHNQQQGKVNANQSNPTGGNHYTVNVIGQVPQNTPNQHNQLFQQYADSKNPLYGKQAPESSPVYQENQAIYFPPPQQPTGLSQPPQLRHSNDRDDVIDPSRNPNAMHQSENNQNQVREILWGEQQQANAFWQQKFFLIYEKFEWFGSRFQMLKGEYAALSEQLITVDSQQDWNELKHHHEQFSQKLQEMFQQLIAVADQNQQLINQRLEQDDGVWERRYHELLSNFKALQQKTSMLEVENQDLKTSNHGGLSQQQQNYPELLSHYRNLEEEYEKLFNAYNKLQEQNDQLKANPSSNGPSLQDFENMRMQYQRTLEAIQNENEGLKNECQGFYEENQHFRQQLQAQAQQLAEIEHLGREIKEKSSFIQSLNQQLSNWRKKYQQLQDQNVDLLSKQTEKIRLSARKFESQINSLQQQLVSKDTQINNLSRRLNDEVRSKQKLIESHNEEIVKAIQLESEKQTRLRSTVEKEFKSLQTQYETLVQQSSITDVSKYQVDSLKKKIEYLQNENAQLTNEIANKNKELIALRNVSLQLTSYENILQQYKILEKTKLSLQETNIKEHNQLLHTKKKLSQIEHQFSEFKNLQSSINMKTSASSQFTQIQSELESQISKNIKIESELQKFKQLVEAKEKYIIELQDQHSKLITKLQFQERLIEGKKQDHQNEVKTLERRIQTLEQRNRSNELQFKKEMTENYEKEIKELRLSNEQKMKKIKKLEEGIQDLSTKSSHLEKHSAIYGSQQQLLLNKLSALQKSNNELLTKLELSSNSVEALDHQLTSYKERQAGLRSQVNNFVVQIQEADNLIKGKNNIIIEYEKQVQQFVQKISSLEDRIDADRYQKAQKMKKYQEQIQKLKQKLYSPAVEENRRDSLFGGNRYSSSYSNRYLSFGTKKPLSSEPKNQEISKLEFNLIEQMNEENSKLRTEVYQLTKKINSLESLSRVLANNQQSPKKSPSKSRISEQVPQKDVGLNNQFIEQRLLKFNERLETCIHDNELIAVRDIDLTASQRVALHEREKRQLQIKYEKEIKDLKVQIKTLNQQLTQLSSQNNKLVDSDLKQFDKYDIMNEHAEKSVQQELEFLKSKLNDQQKTNSTLIKLNEHLKKQLQESLQKGLHSTSQYYKLQWRSTQSNLQQEKQKNKKLQQENDKLKRENIDRDSKVIKDYELRAFAFEEKLQALERENTYLKMVKAKAENQKANFQHDLNVYSADIESIKASSNAKIAHYEKATKQLRQKCSNMQRELHEVNNSLKWGAMNGISRTVLANQKPGQSSSRRVLA